MKSILIILSIVFAMSLEGTDITFSNGRRCDGGPPNPCGEPWDMQPFTVTVPFGQSIIVDAWPKLIFNCGGGLVDFSITNLAQGESITFSGALGRPNGWGYTYNQTGTGTLKEGWCENLVITSNKPAQNKRKLGKVHRKSKLTQARLS